MSLIFLLKLRKHLKGENQMSKPDIGYFKGTNGSSAQVWDSISPTQENYPNTLLPKSFTMDLGNKKLWVSANATGHMYEYVSSQMKHGIVIEGTRLTTQLLLDDMRSSLNKVTANGISYGSKLSNGNWEFVILKPRTKGQYDSVIHAFFKNKGGIK